MICAIHCLLTPILLVSLPILATTFWVHENFHLWMIFLVVPTTGLAVFMGCRKHKDKTVVILSAAGLAMLIFVVVYETTFHTNLLLPEPAHCAQCAAKASGDFLTLTTVASVIGGLLLASGHVRNYLLCRRVNCCH